MNKQMYPTFLEYLKNEYKGPYSATDIIIRHNDGKKNGIVLIDRKNPPHGLAIPGGIAEEMQYWENALKEAKEETGLDVILDDKERPFVLNIKEERGPYMGCHVFTGEGRGILKPHEDEDAKSAAVYTLDEVRDLLKRKNTLAFRHHPEILKWYLKNFS